jgi:hypothetical protein
LLCTGESPSSLKEASGLPRSCHYGGCKSMCANICSCVI